MSRMWSVDETTEIHGLGGSGFVGDTRADVADVG